MADSAANTDTMIADVYRHYLRQMADASLDELFGAERLNAFSSASPSAATLPASIAPPVKLPIPDVLFTQSPGGSVSTPSVADTDSQGGPPVPPAPDTA